MVGPGLSLGAVVSAVQRVALLQWNAQNAQENLDLADYYRATKGDSTAAKRVGQAEERERIRTGRATPEPPSTASESRRQEFGRRKASSSRNGGIDGRELAVIVDLTESSR